MHNNHNYFIVEKNSKVFKLSSYFFILLTFFFLFKNSIVTICLYFFEQVSLILLDSFLLIYWVVIKPSKYLPHIYIYIYMIFIKLIKHTIYKRGAPWPKNIFAKLTTHFVVSSWYITWYIQWVFYFSINYFNNWKLITIVPLKILGKKLRRMG